MKSVLYIKANPKSDEDSITFQMSQRFIETYQRANPDDVITTLDLYKENPRFLNANDLNNMVSEAQFDVRQYAKQFAQHDRIVFAAPMWNLSFPSILKAYLDYVAFQGITFKYTQNGSVGLLAGQGKKVLYLVARGGSYTDEPMKSMELGERYLRTLMAFFGIDDFTTVSCEMTNVLQGEELNNAVAEAVNAAVTAAKIF
ncbi:MAG: NAD(P)H-dependent oxidoreductase [Oscillospiraceae bacterium]|jgi:FMN-dependent NADH-azoreductase|nr:NAD(P)H-dependent oxidoreductase [Oscillospiraceae bacterium]